jgi:hypothetical protein
MMPKRYRAVLAVLVLVFLAGLLIGIPMAIFGSQSDTSPGEQAAALFFGVGMIVFSIVGFIGVVKASTKAGLRIPLICGCAVAISFLLGTTLGF